MQRLEITAEEYLSRSSANGVIASTHVSSKPFVGIWWYLKGELYAFLEEAKDCPQGRLICTDLEHSRTFFKLQELLQYSIPEIKDIRFNQIERGRVWYVPATRSYLITCSTAISKNIPALVKIGMDFSIPLDSVEVRVEAQYDVFEPLIK